jgi:hypothetical protein
MALRFFVVPAMKLQWISILSTRETSMSNKPTQRPKTIRCAIYTRKSTEEGLDQQYNSLDSQRDAGEAYIRSQANEGWEIVPDRYDVDGFSDSNIERPALKWLMEDIQAGKIDCVVVYNVDRDYRRTHPRQASRPMPARTTLSIGCLDLFLLWPFSCFLSLLHADGKSLGVALAALILRALGFETDTLDFVDAY